MFGGINPKKMQAMMKQMGMAQEEILASKITIDKEDGSKLIIHNPSVTKITMQGQETYQIVGEATEETGEVEISEEDIKTIIEKTGTSKEEAKAALEETGDLAEAIMRLR